MSIGKLVLLLLFCQLSQVLAQCPAPFSMQANKCVFVNAAQKFTWCSANQRCASIGGELINSYDTIKQLASMPSINCGCELWIGISDHADERNTNRLGWQMIFGKDILPLNDSLWHPTDPNNINNQDCISTYPTTRKLYDEHCSSRLGFACQFSPTASLSETSKTATWKQISFKRTNYNPSTEYCYTDISQIKTATQCVAAGIRTGNSRQVLYNSKLGTCRLLQFTDAQVEQEIETSQDWKKFSVI